MFWLCSDAPDAPPDLRERALDIAGALLDLAGTNGEPGRRRHCTVDSGAAEAKFLAICAAQGGFIEPNGTATARLRSSETPGRIIAIDNRRIAKIAKLAGAPGRKTSGDLAACVGRRPGGDRHAAFEIHAETPGELAWAQDYARSGACPFQNRGSR